MKRNYEHFLRSQYALRDECVLVVPDCYFEIAEIFLRMLSMHIPTSRWELRRLEFDDENELHIDVELSEMATEYHRGSLMGIINHARYRLKVMLASPIST